MVGAPGHEAIAVLHARRRADDDRAGVRLPFLGQLAQAVVGALHLVDDVAAGGGVVAGDSERVALRIVISLNAADGAIEAAG